MWKGMKIATKVWGGYLLLAILMVLVAGAGIYSVRNLNDRILDLVERKWPLANSTARMEMALIKTTETLSEYWIQQDQAARQELRTETEGLVQEFDLENAVVRKAVERQEEIKAAEDVDILHDKLIKFAGAYLDTLDSHQQAADSRQALLKEASGLAKGLQGGGAVHALINRQVLALYAFLLLGDEEQARQFDALQRPIQAAAGYPAVARDQARLYELGQKLIAVQREYDDYGVQRIIADDEVDVAISAIYTVLDAFENRVDQDFNAAAAGAEATFAASRLVIVMVGAVAVLAGVFMGFILSRLITRPLRSMVDTVQVIASGDLSQRVEVKGRDEVGVLGDAFNAMVTRLNQMMHDILNVARQVGFGSGQVSAETRNLSQAAQSQASTLEETSASVEELTASVEQVADHAQSQAASVEESSNNMDQMQSAVAQVTKTLQAVSSSSQDSMGKAQAGVQAVTQAVEAIQAISESSERIAGIIGVIGDIADQTNLLALNAAIEAARAGEHGRGFAVVADEVSKLADRSSSSTKEIEKLIKESSKSVTAGVEIARAALSSMESIIAGAKKTNEMVNALAADIEQQVRAITEMNKATESIAEMSQSISAATEEQTTNAKQVAKAIENVNELTQQAAGAAEEMSSATEELSGLAQSLQKLVEQFRLSEREAESDGKALALTEAQ